MAPESGLFVFAEMGEMAGALAPLATLYNFFPDLDGLPLSRDDFVHSGCYLD